MPSSIASLSGKLSYLQGSGEMATLTREFDWSSTPLGSPATWPQSLRTSVSILLRSKFPMFLWWGSELIQFYNDAYRPSLGNHGKHPSALGQKGEDCWQEIWPVIKRLIDGVMAGGEATWSEDQLIPIYRNGMLEDVYWTFSYSAVQDDDGIISGVLVVCTDTTDKVTALQRLEKSRGEFERLVELAPVAIATFRGEHFVTEIANEAYLPLVGKTRDEFVGKPLFESLPEARESLEPLVKELLRTGQSFPVREFEIALHRNGKLETCYFNSVWQPLREDDGRVDGFVAVAHEVTAQVIARKTVEESEERFRAIADQSPMMVFIIAPDPTAPVSYWNKAWLDYTGQTFQEAIGRAWDGIVHPDDVPGVLDVYVASFQNREPYTLPAIRLLRHDGAYRWHLFKASPRLAANGEFIGFVGVGTDIHNQKLAEEKLQSFISNAPFPIGIYEGKDMRVCLANQSIIDVWGKGPDVIGKRFADLLPELAGTGLYEQLDDVYTTGEPFHIRNQRVDLATEDKVRSYYFNYSFTPLHDAAGQVYGVMNTAADVTDLSTAQQALAASDQQARSLVMEASVATAVFAGRDMVLELANKAMFQLWDKDESVIGMALVEFLPELKDQDIPQLLDNVFSTGDKYSIQDAPVQLQRAGKLETVYMDFSYTAMRDERGNIVGILENAVDITERALLRRRLARDAENLRSTILKAPVAMCIFRGPKHVVEIANERMIALWGTQPENVMGKPIFEGLPEAKDQGLEELIDGVYATGKTFAAQDVPVMLRRNGRVEVVYLNFIYEAFREPDGTISGIMAVANDVTAQVIARREIEQVVKQRTEELAMRNEELAEANRQLVHSNEELAQYAYVASHDLQEPLRKIRTFASMLTDANRDAEHNGLLLRKISHSAERMSSLIQGLLDFSRLLKSDGGFEPVALHEVAAMVVNDYELAITENGAAVSIGRLPVLQASPLQMNQLFYNLLGNALKFSRLGVAPVIAIQSAPIDAEALSAHIRKPLQAVQYHDITVSDNGIGFETQYSEQIFEVFKRLHTRDIYPGSGIGLALCRRIVVNHGGVLYAESVPGAGTSFHIVLPERQGEA